MKKEKIIKGLLEWLIYIIIFVAIVYGTPKILVKTLHTIYPIAAITSSSMWPALKQGDIVFIKGIGAKTEVKIGDIVVYKNERGFTIHRVIQMDENTLTTKGDANNVEDAPIAYSALVGKTVNLKGKLIRLPYLGKLSQVFRK